MPDIQVSNARRVVVSDGFRFGIGFPARRPVGGRIAQLTQSKRLTIGDGFRFAIGFWLALCCWYLSCVVLICAGLWHWLFFAIVYFPALLIYGACGRRAVRDAEAGVEDEDE